MKNSGLFLNMAKWCFLGLFFWGFNVIVVCFWCVWHSSRSVKNACFFFSQFWGLLWGGLFFFILGLEGLGVFVFLVFVFVFCVAFVSVLFALFLFCCWIVFGVGSCFALVFFFFFVFFFGGFKGLAQRATFGPKPSLFIIFVFCFFFLILFFGGFKGQVRWPKGPPHLALNPPYFFFFLFFFFGFLLFVFLKNRKTVFPLKKGIFVVHSSVFPFVSF